MRRRTPRRSRRSSSCTSSMSRKDARTSDLLYEILLKSGFPLTDAGRDARPCAATTCLQRRWRRALDLPGAELTLELIRPWRTQKPERVVCLDEGFAGNDQLKANAVQIFKTKGVTSFKTV